MNYLSRSIPVKSMMRMVPTIIRSFSASSKLFGVVFDIDGVLMKGSQIIPKSDQAVQFLYEKQIPFCFMTNGGGRTEESAANMLQSKFQVPIKPTQVVESHTHLKQFLPQFHDKKILILGHLNYLEVALHYGYQKVITPQEFLALHPSYYPPKQYTLSKDRLKAIEPYDKEPFSAIMVFHDPIDWAPEIQICMDVLNFTKSNTNKQTIPIYVGNPDLLYTGACIYPRLACRGFLEALNGVYKSVNHEDLNIEYFGKPYKNGYKTCESILNSLAKQSTLFNSSTISEYYGIGDNPNSDILGANTAGALWNSVFVKTGSLPEPKPNTKQYPKYIYDNAFDAVHSIYAKHV